MSKVLIVGGGASGMAASIFAARNGHEVHLFEKNEKLGKKLFITGKGRCNLTNACEAEDFFPAVLRNRKFMYSSFYSFTNQDVITFFNELGVKTKIERGGRVFPVSDHSSDIIRALEGEMLRTGVNIHLYSEVKKIVSEKEKQIFRYIELKDGEKIYGDACVAATGGLSYETTGSTGDGHRFARQLGHNVTELLPALVPLTVREDWVPILQGLSLRNVTAGFYDGRKKLCEDFGEMLFTHYGVSGPIILSASSVIGDKLQKKELTLKVDLKPALTEEQLDHRILRDFEENKNKQFKNSLGKLFPSKLIPVMIYLGGIDAEKKVNEVSREERRRFVSLTKNLEMTVTGLRGFQEAIITRGGVDVKEIDPGTMESRLIRNLYFIGEILDLDAVTGGFNLQIAWSTAYMAGNAIR
ncbi:NAD(P)/FAD-dependent oxidoreductase [Dorea acetigenes]|uniref:NAD(P)/FAD-dependent oxidoreductase n=1 Tax=Dorea acetigenes TaxID=2981787 RepID=A0ABT2RJ37_9FIRM|nr:NAD(P)/FAD-dependent oxidoreductase [Dorea acetigenes]MCU6685412.1 NAD(P)/FAD-dependent oxidoreductase [Dorea acetigenes]SCI51427.1 dihydrolipoamide dehydrogenase [uncultured Clostridium sp.]